MTTVPDRDAIRQPDGLAGLFFAELWERFAYYGMRALLVFFMIRTEIVEGDEGAYAVYASFSLLAYVAPTLAAVLMSTLLDSRRGVIVGALFTIAGLQLLIFQTEPTFFAAMGLIAVGTGFFKPSICARVGRLYRRGDSRLEPGFMLFYIGINIGAMLAPALCGYIGETQGWSSGFGLAAVGMMIGLFIYVGTPTLRSVVAIVGVILAFHSSVESIGDGAEEGFLVGFNRFLPVLALQLALLLGWRGLVGATSLASVEPSGDDAVGNAGKLKTAVVVICGFALAALFAFSIEGFTSFTDDGERLRFLDHETVETLREEDGFLPQVKAAVLDQVEHLEGCLLLASIAGLLIFMTVLAVRQGARVRRALASIVILTLFSMLFWAMFESGGYALNTLTTYNVDRVAEDRVIEHEEIGEHARVHPTQEQLGYDFAGSPFGVGSYDTLSESNPDFEIGWPIEEEHVGMGVASADDEVPASAFYGLNPAAIFMLGGIIVLLWTFLLRIGIRIGIFPSFALGFVLAAAGWALLWLGTKNADSRGVMSATWLVSSYSVMACGELLIAPIGLAAVARLAPRGQMMIFFAFWFIMTAVCGSVATVGEETFFKDHQIEVSGATVPNDLLEPMAYRFGSLALVAVACAACCLVLSFFLRRWTDPLPADDDSGESPNAAPKGPAASELPDRSEDARGEGAQDSGADDTPRFRTDRLLDDTDQ